MIEKSSLDIQFQKHFSRNLLSNIAYFLLNIIFGLALVPFFLDTLGNSAYGLIPLATSITSYVTLIIDAVNTSVSRYLTIDMQHGDVNKANITFNTALFGTLGIILLMVPVVLFVAWLAPYFFSIGDTAVDEVMLFFALIFGSVLIRAWSSNFMVTLFAYNRLDLRNYVSITNIFVQFVLVVILFLCFGPSLIFVGTSYFIAAVTVLVMAFILSRRQCPFLKISPRYYIRTRMRELVGTAGWFAFLSIGNLLFMNVALIIVNTLFGDVAGTQYSLVYMWGTLLLGIASLLTNVFVPNFFSYYTKGDKMGLINFGSFAIKITGLFMALPIGLICIFAPQLLTLWVGEEYAFLAPLMWIIVIPILVRTQAGCIYPIYVVYNKVRVPAIATCIIGGLNVILALTLPIVFHLGIYGVAYATAISMILFSAGFSAIYNAHLLQAPLFTFLKEMGVGIGALTLMCSCGYAYTILVSVDSLLHLLLSGIVISLLYILFILKIVLKKEERKIIQSYLPRIIQDSLPQWIFK